MSKASQRLTARCAGAFLWPRPDPARSAPQGRAVERARSRCAPPHSTAASPAEPRHRSCCAGRFGQKEGARKSRFWFTGGVVTGSAALRAAEPRVCRATEQQLRPACGGNGLGPAEQNCHGRTHRQSRACHRLRAGGIWPGVCSRWYRWMGRVVHTQ